MPRATAASCLAFLLLLPATWLTAAPADDPANPLADDATERQQDFARVEQAVAQAAERYDADDLLGALRSYQRAYFWAQRPGEADIPWPGGTEPEWLQEIVPLAMSLGRLDEAVRYARRLPPSATDDPPTLRRLAMYAREQGEWQLAVQLQERWLASRGGSAAGFEALMTRLEIGRFQFLADNPTAASRAFEQVQRAILDKRLPSSVRTRLSTALGGSLATTWEVFGQAHLEAGRLKLATAAFEQLAAAPDAAPRAAYWLARIALTGNKPLDAYDLLRKRLETTDDDLGASSYKLLKDIYTQLNQPAGVLTELRQIASDRPQDLAAALVLGIELKDAGEAREAEAVLARVFRRSVSAATSDPLWIGIHETDEPEVDYRAIALSGGWLLQRYASTDAGDAFFKVVTGLHECFGTLEEFTEAFTEAFETYPAFARIVFARLDLPDNELPLLPAAIAELSAIAGRQDAADAAFQSAIQGADEEKERQGLALLWWQYAMLAEEYDRAAAALRWSIDQQVWPDEASDPYFHLSAALVLDKQPEAAVEAAQAALDRNSDDPATAQRLGWTYSEADRPEDAIECYKYLIQRFDDSTDSATRDVLREARLALSYLSDDLGDANAGAEWALEVLDEFPDAPGALNDLGYLWTKQGIHLHRAVRMAQQAVELKPDNAAYWDSLGWAQFRLGDHPAALQSIEQALELQSESSTQVDAEILDHLGDIQAARGETAAARDAWRRSADAYEQADERDAAERVRNKLEPEAAAP